MIRIRDISVPAEHTVQQLGFEAAKLLKVSSSQIRKLRIVKKSIDARKKPDVKVIYTVDVSVDGSEEKLLRRSGCKKASLAPKDSYRPPKATGTAVSHPVIVGFGPAGMFAALILAMAGKDPVVLERGDCVETRKEKVEHFFAGGALDTRSNIQFGEGGAGTFSDGKLNTGVNNPRISWILEQFVSLGARENILYDAKPHVGTDVLMEVVRNLRCRIQSLGGEIRFNAQMTDIRQENGRVTAVQVNGEEWLPCDALVLAIGHSARDTFEKLHTMGIPMEPKAFAMGARIEHKQTSVNIAQYGKENPALPPADYKLVQHLPDGSAYTFCMCPGGYVVAAASEEGGVVTNGMSYADRDGENANAAVLVTVTPEDFPYPGTLGGMYWQRQIEQRAFQVSGSYRAPAQRVGDFLAGKPSTAGGDVKPTYRPGVAWCDLHDVLPAKLTGAMEQAIPLLDRKLAGFSHPDAVLTAPETRSSSPVRILRDETRQSTLRGLYPCGEGAGYAGGIMSAAVDGIMTAEAILSE